MEKIKIGKIVNTHGIKGECKIYTYTNDIVSLSKLKCVYIDENKYTIVSSKIYKNMLIIKFSDIDSIEQITKLLNTDIYIEKNKITKQDTYYVEDLINLDVYSLENDEYVYYGKLTQVLQPRS